MQGYKSTLMNVKLGWPCW